jgi:hypothetical protein
VPESASRAPVPAYDAPLAERLRFGLGHSGPLAVVGALLYVVAVLLGGRSTLTGARLAFTPTAWGSLLGLALSGPIFYALRPWHRRRAGAVAAGVLAGFPAAYYFIALISAEPAADASVFLGRLAEAVLIAGVGGWLFGDQQWRHDHEG